MASVKEELEFPEAEIRPMHELDVPVVVAIERSSYQFPWSEGIFRDCLRVGYICRVVETGGDIAGYGIMSMGAGEAHVLNVCIRGEYRGRGLARKVLLYLLDRARNAGMYEAFLEVSAVQYDRRASLPFPGVRTDRRAAAAIIRRATGARMRRCCGDIAAEKKITAGSAAYCAARMQPLPTPRRDSLQFLVAPSQCSSALPSLIRHMSNQVVV